MGALSQAGMWRQTGCGTIPCMITLYGLPNCDTVKKARGWLQARGVAHQFHDFKKQGVPADLMSQWLAELGWETLLNKKGTTWRKLSPDTQSAVVDAPTALALMLTEPSSIKRPIVKWADRTTVGFDEALWSQLLP
jgi:Spx/MgsR family transcriptional regulator